MPQNNIVVLSEAVIFLIVDTKSSLNNNNICAADHE